MSEAAAEPPQEIQPSVGRTDVSQRPSPAGWRRLALPVAAVWSVVYLGLGCAWLAGAGGNPADPAVDPGWRLTLLGAWGPRVGAAVITGAAAVGILVAAAMTRSRARLLRLPATVLGLALAVIVPDYRLINYVAYLPVQPVLKLAGIVPDYLLSWPWPVVNQALTALAGLAWLVAVSEHARRAADGPLRRVRPQAAARWGRWATAVAVAVPLSYALTRFAWALGIPLGITRQLLDKLGDLRYAGALLGVLAVAGAILTLGLVQRWGEVFPRWIPGLHERRVPVGLAIVPAYLVSAILASAGLMVVRVVVTGSQSTTFPGLADGLAAWVWVPEMLWVVWAAALAAATYLYQVRCMLSPRTP